MTYSLWDRAQRKTLFDYPGDWPKRCDLCGRRLKVGDYASVFIGKKTDTEIIIHEICYQHGGWHFDCLIGVDVDFGDGKSWPVIWMSNLLHELTFWLKSIMRFVWLVFTFSLHIVVHPIRYYRCRRWWIALCREGYGTKEDEDGR